MEGHIDAFISGLRRGPPSTEPGIVTEMETNASIEPSLTTCCSTERGSLSNAAESAVIKRGRKPKYFSEEDRRLAKREQNRRYRDRKREELTALRRLAASYKNDDSSAFRGDINIEESKT